MSTPFEFGAGYDDGSSFVQDQDGEVFFQLQQRITTTNSSAQVFQGDYSTQMIFTHVIGDPIKGAILSVDSGNYPTDRPTKITPPTPGRYLVNLQALLSAGTDDLVKITLVSSAGPTWTLFKGATLTGGTAINGSAIVDVGVTAGAIDTFKVTVLCATYDNTITIGSATAQTALLTWQQIIKQGPVVTQQMFN